MEAGWSSWKSGVSNGKAGKQERQTPQQWAHSVVSTEIYSHPTESRSRWCTGQLLKFRYSQMPVLQHQQAGLLRITLAVP
jgi:hypothetical protein